MFKPSIPPITVACLCMLAPSTIARPGASAPEPVNGMCPIGKEPVVPSAGTVEHDGNTIGLCCPGCGEAFLAWDEQRRDEFVTLAIAHREPGRNHANRSANADHDAPAMGGASPGPSYPYTLPDCPVGGPLGSMGDPVVNVYDNREVRFCCAGCIEEFENNKAEYWSQIDEKIVEQQLMHYPIDTCIVTGGGLGDDAIDHVHNNRLVRLADADALETFRADPARHLEALDEKIVEAQRPGYPMDNCPVGGPLGSMGEPVDFIYMNRLVRFCCAGCEDALVNEPAEYMARIDTAYADRQRDDYPLETCVVSGAPLGSMGDPVELVAGSALVRFCCDNCIPKFKENPGSHRSKLSRE